MEENYKTNSFKKLLDRLQEDSWQLELLISGFAIIGLFYALEPVAYKILVAQFDNNQIFLSFLVNVYFSLQILIFNLLLHVLLRGLWIGSLGLRYVFGDIDFEALNYGEQFTSYLKRKVGSFDAYIEKLENLCSVIFALTFLLVFYVFSSFVIGLILIIFSSEVPDWLVGITRGLFALFSIGVVLTFIDFITLGLLKKNKWVAKIYFPFYWLFSYLTVSFLYRPLVYNLLDNKYGRRISLGLVPFYLLIYFVFHLNYQKSNFITKDNTKLSNSYIANGSNYQDVIEKSGNVFIGEFAIQSKVITQPYIQLMVPLNAKVEDALMDFNSSLKPEKDNRGLYFQSEISVVFDAKNYDSLSIAYLNSFQKKYSFKIDGVSYPSEFVISNVNNEMGFETYIGIEDLAQGKHVIEFQSLKHADSDSIRSIRKVPFWYYKN